MNGEKELQKIDLKNKIETLEARFQDNRKKGNTDFNLLDQINTLKDELASLDTCDLDGECLSCGS